MNWRLFKSPYGMSLIELLVVIVVIGILTAVSMKTMTTSVEDLKRVRTERELDAIGKAIVGDPNETNDLSRSNFGYVGDVGAFPPNLAALRTNPGGYSTWNGPYLQPGVVEDSTGYLYDEWGKAYSYSGGVTISSTGNGTAIVKRIADATADYTRNQFKGMVQDKNDSLPGAIKKDSVSIKVTIPNGSGSSLTKSYKPDATGLFTLDSIPAGHRSLLVIYSPQNDTIARTITVLPRQRTDDPPVFRFTGTYFSSAGGCSASVTIRPNGNGSKTDLTSSGCASHWQCVSETVADEDASRVICADNSYHDDYYAMENPVAGACNPTKVTVWCRAKKNHTQGDVRQVVFVGGTAYAGTFANLTTSYVNYSYSWTTNPKTGAAWTWTDINNLEAGVRLTGQNSGKPAYCTQVWVVVDY
jgi:prepilin-type N-terminal cleavage/methylation domain-containing protein